MITAQKARRFDVWSAPQCAGGTRLAVLTNVASAVASASLGGDSALRLSLPLLEPSVAEILAHRIVRVDENDTPSFDEWRIDDVSRDAASGMLSLVAVPIATILGRRALVDQIDGLGVRRYNFDIVGMTPSAIIAAYILPALTAAGVTWVSSGTISDNAPIDVSVSWDSPWSLLKKIEEVTKLELDLQRVGTTSYTINLLTALNASAPIADIRFGKNLLTSTLRSSTDLQATRIYGRGGEQDGYHATLARAVWKVSAVASNVVSLIDPTGVGDGPIVADGQLVGRYLRKVDGSLTQITASSYSAQSVTVASATGVAPNDLVQVRADATGTDLTALDSPADVTAWGIVVGTLDEPSIPATNNVIPNPSARIWPSGTIPSGWSAVGSPTTSKELGAAFVQSAGQSIKVIAAAAGAGVITAAGVVKPSAAQPYGSAYANVLVASGQVRVELVVTTASTTVVFPTTPQVASSSVLNQWEALGVSGEDLNAIGALSVQVRVVAHGGAATFYVDSAQVTETASQQPYFEGSGGTRLWQAVNDRLRLYGAPASEHRFTLVDLARIDPATWGGDCSVYFGGRAQVYDARVVGGTAFYSSRIVSLERDYIVPGNTAITLSTRPEDLQGALARPGKPKRIPVTEISDYPADGVGPSLDVKATPGTTSYSIVYSGTPPVFLSINGGTFTSAPASPIVVTRPAAGSPSDSYSFQSTENGQTVTNDVTVPAVDKDTVTPDLVATPGTPTATTLNYVVSATNPGGGATPTIAVTLRGTTGTASTSGALADGATVALVSGETLTINRPAFGTVTQASMTLSATVSGGGSEVIQRTIANQVKGTFGPSLDVVSTPGSTSYSIAYAGTSGVELSINGGAYSAAPATPITVTRPAVGASPLEYTFRVSADGETVTNLVTIQPIDKDTVTPDLVVVPGTQTATTQAYTVTATNPSGGSAPTITVTLRGTTGTSAASGALASGATVTIPSGDVVTVNRPAFGTTASSSTTFVASLSGGGSETIQRTNDPQVKTTFGPTLDVVTTAGTTTYSIGYNATGTLLLSINGGAYSAPAASPIVVTRPAAGAASTMYSFRADADGQQITNDVLIPAIDANTVTPELSVVPSNPTATQQDFTVTTSNPSGGAVPGLNVECTGCSMVIGGTTYGAGSVVTISSGTVVTANRPAFGTTTQASLTFKANLGAGNGVERIQRTILNQVKTSFGPSLDVSSTPGTGSYSIAYSGTGTITLSIDGGAYGSPAASPITVTRTASDHTYSFKAVLDGQTVVTAVTIPAAMGVTGSGPGFSSISFSGSPNYAGNTIDISWVPDNVPSGTITYNVTVWEQTHPTNATRGQTFVAVGVTAAYTYSCSNDIDASGSLTKTYKAFVEMIVDGLTVAATSATVTTVLNSNT